MLLTTASRRLLLPAAAVVPRRSVAAKPLVIRSAMINRKVLIGWVVMFVVVPVVNIVYVGFCWCGCCSPQNRGYKNIFLALLFILQEIEDEMMMIII